MASRAIFLNSYLITFICQFLFFCILNYLTKTSFFRKIFQSKKKFKLCLLIVIGCHLLAIMILRKEVRDVMLFSGAGWYLRHKIDFYWIDSNHVQYPFFPFLIFFFALANYLTEIYSFFTFSFYLKLLLLLPSLYYLSWLIKNLQLKKSLIKARQTQIDFLTSPITYAVILFHGQFDVVLLVFYFISLQLLFTKKVNLNNFFMGSFSLAISVAVKTWSVLFLPLFWKFQKNLWQKIFLLFVIILFLFLDVFIYTRYVFGSSFKTVLPALLPVRSLSPWGYAYIFSFFPVLFSWLSFYKSMLFILLFIMTEYIILTKNFNVWQASLMTILGLFIIMPNWAPQYLFWIMPFIYLLKNKLNYKMVNIFQLLATIFIFFDYLQISMQGLLIKQFNIIIIIGFILWLFLVFWFMVLLNKRTVKRISL